MICAILCPGPSLCQTYRGGHDLTIAVNRAAVAYPKCDWWAALDLPLIRDWHGRVIGSPKILTSRTAARDLKDHAAVRQIGMVIDDLVGVCDVKGWTLYTATSALVLAAHLGATDIEVYGADWTDAPDYDGIKDAGARRTESRWLAERHIWGQMCLWLAARGGSVKRFLPEKAI